MKITGIIEREVESQVKRRLEEGFIAILLGGRQVGKTTLIKKIQKEIKGKTYYFLLESVDLASKISHDLYYLQHEIENDLGSTLENFRGEITVFIDEAQKVPEIFELVKIWHDTYPQKIRIVLSGSSSLEIQKHTSESLAGRASYIHMFPLTFREIFSHEFNLVFPSIFPNFEVLNLDFLRQMQSKIYSRKNEISMIRDEILLRGALPGVLTHDTREENVYMQSIIEIYLEKDIRGAGLVRDLSNYNKLLEIASAEVGGMINIQELSRTVQISAQTIKAHLSILENTFLMHFLSPYVSARDRAVKSNKWYFFDTGIPNYIARRTTLPNVFDSHVFGGLWESVIFSNLLAFTKNRPASYKIFFWRNYSGREIDLILEKADFVLPVEITFSSKIISRKIDNLEFFFEINKNAKYGVVLYGGDLKEIEVSGKKVFLIPWFLWI